MRVQQVSRLTSVPRRHKLGLLLVALTGWYITGWFWPTDHPMKAQDWNAFAAALAAVAATMVSLTVALTAILYALLGTPLLKFLHQRGALNRVLFDLMVCAVLWLFALALALLGALPGYGQAQAALRVATSAAVAGLLYFGPIGNAFWLLLRHTGDQPPEGSDHDFSKPTNLS